MNFVQKLLQTWVFKGAQVLRCVDHQRKLILMLRRVSGGAEAHTGRSTAVTCSLSGCFVYRGEETLLYDVSRFHLEVVEEHASFAALVATLLARLHGAQHGILLLPLEEPANFFFISHPLQDSSFLFLPQSYFHLPRLGVINAFVKLLGFHEHFFDFSACQLESCQCNTDLRLTINLL